MSYRLVLNTDGHEEGMCSNVIKMNVDGTWCNLTILPKPSAYYNSVIVDVTCTEEDVHDTIRTIKTEKNIESVHVYAAMEGGIINHPTQINQLSNSTTWWHLLTENNGNTDRRTITIKVSPSTS